MQNRIFHLPRKCAHNLQRSTGALLALLVLCGCSAFGPPVIESGEDSPLVLDRLVPTPPATHTPAPAPRSTSPLSPVQSTPPLSTPPLAEPYTLRWRAGVGIPDGGDPAFYQWRDPRPGWYLNWHYGALDYPVETAGALPTAEPQPDIPGQPDYLALDIHIPDDLRSGMHYVPMVYNLDGSTAELESLVTSLPGRTWLIGNEPDVRWQGNRTPESYARAYQRIYHIIKQRDPAAKIAIGGISQVTPLRLAYLDRVLDTYQAEFGDPMPVDVWNIHTFVLQEKRDDWGVDIPPGFEDVTEGTLWTIEDHGDLTLVEQQIRTMRAWMQARGQQQKPLWITEYGILMPAEFGFPPSTVAEFMVDSFDLFLNLQDPELGWAADDHRLVQRWIWFSAGYDRYPTGNLFDPNGRPTPLLSVYRDYLHTHAE